MKNFKKLMLMILMSNITIFAEGGLNFLDDNGLTNPATSSHFASQQLPVSVLFVNVSLTYSQPIIRMFCFMYAVVAESFYAGVMNFSFGERAASMKRNEGSLNIQAMDENVLAIIPPEDCSRHSTSSPCFFIGSPPPSPGRTPGPFIPQKQVFQ